MNLQTLVITPENWAIATSTNKDALLWSIKDRPWLNLRTYNLKEKITIPCQIKSNSWLTIEPTSNIANKDVELEALLVNARLSVFTDLQLRISLNIENQGLFDVNSTILDFYNYLGSAGVVQSEYKDDSRINFENKIRILQDLYNIRDRVIEVTLAARTKEAFTKAREEMERLFFTNILL